MLIYMVAKGGLAWTPPSSTVTPLPFFSLRLSFSSPPHSNINSSPGNDRAISLRLHVVVKVRIHFFFTAVASADVISWGQHVPTSSDASEPIVSLLFVLHAVIQVELPPLSFTHLPTEEDVMGGRVVATRGVVKVMMVVVVCLFRQSPSGVTALPICVDGTIVVCTGTILAAVVASPTEEQTGFVTIVSAIAATATRCYGVPAAGVPTPLLAAAAGQENGNKCDDQEQGQKWADHGACHNSCTGRILKGFCRGDGGVGRRDGKMGRKKRKRKELMADCKEGSSVLRRYSLFFLFFKCVVVIIVVSSSTCVTILLQVCSNVLLSVIPWWGCSQSLLGSGWMGLIHSLPAARCTAFFFFLDILLYRHVCPAAGTSVFAAPPTFASWGKASTTVMVLCSILHVGVSQVCLSTLVSVEDWNKNERWV